MDTSDRKLIIKIASGVVLTIALISVFTFAIRWATADLRGRADVREKTVANGDFRIATYEQYFDLCASVQDAEARIANAEKELAANPADDRKAQLQQVVTAQSNVRAESINAYNSKATQEHRQAFLDAALPYQLSLTAKETQCAA